MIKNMKVEFGRTSDIDSWMRLVRKVSWNFPGSETEQSIDEHKIIVLKFMNDKRALCVKNGQDIVGVLLYSRKRNLKCCLAVDPAYRKRGITSLLLREAIDKLDRDKDITVSTFRENDVKGIAPRKLYKKFGFEEAEKAQNAARALFSGNAMDTEHMPSTQLTEADLTDGAIGILTLMVKAGLAASNGEARRLVVQGGVLADGEKVAAPTVSFTAEQLAKGIVIKKGKKIYHKVTL